MLKETPRSLRQYFWLVSALSIVLGAAALVPSQASVLDVSLGGAGIAFGLVYGWIAYDFDALLAQRPGCIKIVLSANLALRVVGSALLFFVGAGSGTVFPLVVSVLVYLYLVRSVDRLSKETRLSGTPPIIGQDRKTWVGVVQILSVLAAVAIVVAAIGSYMFSVRPRIIAEQAMARAIAEATAKAQDAQKRSQVEVNLLKVAALAEAYFEAENQPEQVSVSELNAWMPNVLRLDAAAGENYDNLVVGRDWRTLSITIAGGMTVSIKNRRPANSAAVAGLPKPEAASAMGARQILDRVEQIYRGCQSYQDSGLVETVFFEATGQRTRRLSFKTALVRSHTFRFEFREGSDSYVVWSNGVDVRSWWSIQPGVKDEESLARALGGATGVSAGSAHTIPALLFPDDVQGRRVTRMENVRQIADAELGTVTCHRFQGQFGEDPVTVWTDAATFLIRRIDEGTKFDSFRTETTTTYDAQVNGSVPQQALAFDRTPHS